MAAEGYDTLFPFDFPQLQAIAADRQHGRDAKGFLQESCALVSLVEARYESDAPV
jgi:hypothetical protein